MWIQPIKMIPEKNKPQVKVLYIPNGEYITMYWWFDFAVGHFYVERYREKKLTKLVNTLNNFLRYEGTVKYISRVNLPIDHNFSIEEFELVYIPGD